MSSTLTSSKALPYIGAALAGALAAAAAYHILPCPVTPKSRAKGVFVLAVSVTIKPGTLALFKEKWGVLAAHCRSAAEPNCLSYELCVKEGSNDTEVLIYERYVSKADLEVTHAASAPFKAFGKWLAEESNILVAKSKATYFETNVGHMVR